MTDQYTLICEMGQSYFCQMAFFPVKHSHSYYKTQGGMCFTLSSIEEVIKPESRVVQMMLMIKKNFRHS